MGQLMVFSPSSILFPRTRLHSSGQQKLPIPHYQTKLAQTSPICFLPTNRPNFPTNYIKQKQNSWRITAGPAGIISDSLSQDLTLGYGALVGIGGVMGYLKGGSKKSLIAGGVSTALLYYVYSILPSNPVLASLIGLGLSASLMGVMAFRLKKTGKIFPAGLVFFLSLIMSGGYLHGILRGLNS